jgi:hypothetical protein
MLAIVLAIMDIVLLYLSSWILSEVKEETFNSSQI